jgi:hypothetical protein
MSTLTWVRPGLASGIVLSFWLLSSKCSYLDLSRKIIC